VTQRIAHVGDVGDQLPGQFPLNPKTPVVGRLRNLVLRAADEVLGCE
jgi:hypothetical protein